LLGHSRCGAVHAAIKHIDAKDALPGSIGDLVETIKPAVAAAKGRPGDLLDNVIKAKRRARRRTPERSGTDPGRPVKKGAVKVVGAVYDLRSGKVTAFPS